MKVEIIQDKLNQGIYIKTTIKVIFDSGKTFEHSKHLPINPVLSEYEFAQMLMEMGLQLKKAIEANYFN